MISKNQIKWIRQLEQKKFRKRDGLFVAEGPKIVGDLMRRYKPHTVFATSDWEGSVNVSVSDDELRKISFLQHPQQVLAVFPIPTVTSSIDTTQLYLALDGIQDPGNLGTIIRIADWFGIKTIFCSQDTVDAYNPKVVQATMGSIARVEVVYTNLAELFTSLPADFPVYGTLLDGENLYSKQLSAAGMIIMGNEGNGISQPIRPFVHHRLLIPQYSEGDTAESLNVAIATAITCAMREILLKMKRSQRNK